MCCIHYVAKILKKLCASQYPEAHWNGELESRIATLSTMDEEEDVLNDLFVNQVHQGGVFLLGVADGSGRISHHSGPLFCGQYGFYVMSLQTNLLQLAAQTGLFHPNDEVRIFPRGFVDPGYARFGKRLKLLPSSSDMLAYQGICLSADHKES